MHVYGIAIAIMRKIILETNSRFMRDLAVDSLTVLETIKKKKKMSPVLKYLTKSQSWACEFPFITLKLKINSIFNLKLILNSNQKEFSFSFLETI